MEEQESQEVEIRPDETAGPADLPGVTVEELIPAEERAVAPMEESALRAVIEAIVYVAEEPITAAQVANALGQPPERIQGVLAQIAAEFEKPEHGIAVREVAGGYKIATKPEHHEAVRAFAKSLKPPLKLSLAALETLAVIAYKQPVTAPEIQEIRGVQGAGVVKTLLDRKLVAPAGRKNVVGKPILYKTTKEFLIQFGLKDLAELPTLKEFEEIKRMAFGDSEEPAPAPLAEVAESGEAKGPAPAAEGLAEAVPEAEDTAPAEEVQAGAAPEAEGAAPAEVPAEPSTEPPAAESAADEQPAPAEQEP